MNADLTDVYIPLKSISQFIFRQALRLLTDFFLLSQTKVQCTPLYFSPFICEEVSLGQMPRNWTPRLYDMHTFNFIRYYRLLSQVDVPSHITTSMFSIVEATFAVKFIISAFLMVSYCCFTLHSLDYQWGWAFFICSLTIRVCSKRLFIFPCSFAYWIIWPFPYWSVEVLHIFCVWIFLVMCIKIITQV